MSLPFLDRAAETLRLQRALRGGAGTRFVVLYGRRRVGKSRLLAAALTAPQVLFVGDDRDASLQRADLAREMARLVPGMADVTYPGFLELLDRFFREAPRAAVLVLDELPSLVRQAPELPSLLQKLLDRRDGLARRLVVCGSSQRMMQGLVLDGNAPLYGRANEIMKVEPLAAPWIARALRTKDAADAIERYAVWGGIPRYWELARPFQSQKSAVRSLVLDPGGVLHREPDRLLLDELDSTARAATVLALVGAGVRRLSEIGARLGVPATTVSRPLSRLVELGILVREVPFGVEERDAKRSYYRIADPFLAFWFRFVDRHRSLLEGRRFAEVEREIGRDMPHHVSEIHEDLCRAATPHLVRGSLGVARRWWGRTQTGQLAEIDVVAMPRGAGAAVVGEVKRTLDERDVNRESERLVAIARAIPQLAGRDLTCVLFALRGSALSKGRARKGVRIVGPDEVLAALDHGRARPADG